MQASSILMIAGTAEAGSMIMDIMGNFAFPVAVVIALMLAIAKVLKSYREDVQNQKDDVKELNRQYHDDYRMIADALNNNTNAINNMNRLIEHLLEKGE